MNPNNKRETFMQQSLPNLLFRQCHTNCVDSDSFLAESAGEKLCVQNCQEKTYQAFDMYMLIKMRMDAHKSTLENVVDISAFTGMEVEHSHDTESELPSKRGVHVPVE
jgi:hypothetical protein